MATVRTDFSPQPQDWTEDTGRYMNTCVGCSTVFLGDKRRPTCRTCGSGPVPKEGMDLLLEAYRFGQFADDFDQPLAKPIRAALRSHLDKLHAPVADERAALEALDYLVAQAKSAASHWHVDQRAALVRSALTCASKAV